MHTHTLFSQRSGSGRTYMTGLSGSMLSQPEFF